jgi:hypothetical protein
MLMAYLLSDTPLIRALPVFIRLIITLSEFSKTIGLNREAFDFHLFKRAKGIVCPGGNRRVVARPHVPG